MTRVHSAGVSETETGASINPPSKREPQPGLPTFSGGTVHPFPAEMRAIRTHHRRHLTRRFIQHTTKVVRRSERRRAAHTLTCLRLTLLLHLVKHPPPAPTMEPTARDFADVVCRPAENESDSREVQACRV